MSIEVVRALPVHAARGILIDLQVPFDSPWLKAGLGSPKFALVLGPFNKTEFFFGAGYD